MTTNEIITLIDNIAFSLSFIAAIIFGVAQVKAAKRDSKERFTLETLRTFQTHRFAEFVFHVNATAIPPTYELFQKMPAEDQVLFIQLSMQMESLGILVAQELIEISLVDKILGTFIINLWAKLKTLTLDTRRTQSNPYFSEHFQWLAERLNEEMKTNPRKPFHKLHPIVIHDSGN